MPSDWTKNKGGARTGLPTSVRHALTAAGFKPNLIRKNFQFGGYVVIGGSRDASVFVSWRAPDDMAEGDVPENRAMWLTDYASALEVSGYLVRRHDGSLTVSKPDKTWTEVYRKGTHDVVGWITPGEFRDTADGKPSGKILPGT